MMGMQLRIFVSHSSQDSTFCRALVQALRETGADVWYDEHNLGAGVLRREINDELAKRPVVLVMVSKAALTSQWVQDECEWAYNLYRRKPDRLILPVVAAPYDPDDFDHMLFLESLKRIEAPDNRPLPATEAIARTLRVLHLAPAGQRPASAMPQAAESLDDVITAGKALAAQHKYAEALPFFERATELAPNSFPAWFNMGRCREELSQYREARTAFERATRLDARSEDAWYYLGATLNGLHAYEEAVDAFGHALALDFTYMFAWQGKVAALTQLGRTHEAEQTEQRAISLGWWV